MLKEIPPVLESARPFRCMFSETIGTSTRTILQPFFREGGYAWQSQPDLWTGIAGQILRRVPVEEDEAPFLHEAVRDFLDAPWRGGESLLARFRGTLQGVPDPEIDQILSCGENLDELPSMGFLSVDPASKTDSTIRGSVLVRNWASGPETWERRGQAIEPGPRAQRAGVSPEECFAGWVCRVVLLAPLAPAAWERLGESGMRALSRFHLPVCTFAASGKEFIPSSMQTAPTDLAVTGSVPVMFLLAEQLLKLVYFGTCNSDQSGTENLQKTHLADCGFLLPRGFVRKLFRHCPEALSLRAWGSDFTKCGLDDRGRPLPIGPVLPGSTPLAAALKILVESNGGDVRYNPHFTARKRISRADIQELIPQWAQAFPEELGRIAIVGPAAQQNARPALDVLFGNLLREPGGPIYAWQEPVLDVLSKMPTVPVQSLEAYLGAKRNAEIQLFGNTASVLAKWTGRLPANREEALRPDPLTGVPPALKAISSSVHVMPDEDTLFLVRDMTRNFVKTGKSFPETGLGAFSERLSRSPKMGELGENALKRQAKFFLRFSSLILDPETLSRQAVDVAGHTLPLCNASFLRTTLKWGDRSLAIQIATSGMTNPALWDIEARLPGKPKEHYPLWKSFLDTLARYQTMDEEVLRNYLRFGECAAEAGRADILLEMKARAAKTSHAPIAEALLDAIEAKLVKVGLLPGQHDNEEPEPIL
jgi:hypothetical protein